MTLIAIATAAIAHRSYASVLAVSAMGGGLEIRPALLRIAEGLSHGEPRRHAQGPTRVVGMPFQVWWFLLPNAAKINGYSFEILTLIERDAE
ncbi:hypothetical protein [Ensifer sp. SL37]|uniref:hypothetical protein n=1 Tax=Ensifer sp. SL37 TaxID=2995137 RepID=UPI002274D523|nr:hypothetical protein [Ensifer sp. SL37]MCY1746344.1 hypothetical protein [Ensifer sp. SL37]